jgi:hypothetical protein
MSRLTECLSIMKQLYDLGFDSEYAPLKEISKKLSDYVKTGKPETFTVSFKEYGRVAHLVLPENPDLRIGLTLKAIQYGKN